MIGVRSVDGSLVVNFPHLRISYQSARESLLGAWDTALGRSCRWRGFPAPRSASWR
jgi:hypothetical protein